MIPSSAAAVHLPASGIREIVNLVAGSPDGQVARLEIGEPDAPPPGHVLAAVEDALGSRLGYVQSAGVPALREAIVARLRRLRGLEVPLSRVLVTHGAVQGILVALATVVAPGDEVLVPDPAWPNYEMQATLLGARIVRYPLRPEDGFLPDPERIAALVTPRTRALVLNSPGNPSGAVLDAGLMQRVVELAAARGLLVVSDEVYDEIVFDGAHVGAHEFAPASVASVFSFSKTYSMTGWRVGYVVLPEHLAVSGERVQETMLSCVATPSQIAALAALTGPQDSVVRNLERYRARRALALELFAAGGVEVPVPGGAFYLLVPLARGADSRAAALDLVRWGVSVAPGSAFGEVARSFLRLSLASSEDTLRAGIARLLDWHAATDAGRDLLGASV